MGERLGAILAWIVEFMHLDTHPQIQTLSDCELASSVVEFVGGKPFKETTGPPVLVTVRRIRHVASELSKVAQIDPAAVRRGEQVDALMQALVDYALQSGKGVDARAAFSRLDLSLQQPIAKLFAQPEVSVDTTGSGPSVEDELIALQLEVDALRQDSLSARRAELMAVIGERRESLARAQELVAAVARMREEVATVGAGGAEGRLRAQLRELLLDPTVAEVDQLAVELRNAKAAVKQLRRRLKAARERATLRRNLQVQEQLLRDAEKQEQTAIAELDSAMGRLRLRTFLGALGRIRNMC